MGHKGSDGESWTRLFQAFQAHYGFDSSLCNPYSGHEKGAVEAKVGMVRRKLFVPRPVVWSLDNFNKALPDRCLALGAKPHYGKDKEEASLFAEDQGALLPLPAKRFDVAAWKRMRTDKRGMAALEGRHRYSADASNARREVIVGLRALEGRDSRRAGQPPGDAPQGVRAGQHKQRGPVHAARAAVQQAERMAQQPRARHAA